MNRHNVIRQPLGVIIATFAAIMLLVATRVACIPSEVETGLTADMPLGQFIDGIFPGALSSCIAGIIIAFISATMLTGIIVRYSVSVVRTYLPMILYTLIAYGTYFPAGSVSATLTPLLLVMSCGRMIASFKRSYQFSNVFRSGFYIGIIPMIYAPSVVLLAIAPITLILYRRTLREAAVAFAGLILPWLYCSVIWWGAGEKFGYISAQLLKGIRGVGTPLSFIQTVAASDIWQKGFFVLCTVATLYSAIIMVRNLGSVRTRTRKIYIHFLWLLLLCTGLLLLPSGNIISGSLTAVPVCVVITTFFIRDRGWLSLAFYILLILSVAYINLSALMS